jgi:hypothetical protein
MLQNITTSDGTIVKKGKTNKDPSHNLLMKLNKGRKARPQICHEQKNSLHNQTSFQNPFFSFRAPTTISTIFQNNKP